MGTKSGRRHASSTYDWGVAWGSQLRDCRGTDRAPKRHKAAGPTMGCSTNHTLIEQYRVVALAQLAIVLVDALRVVDNAGSNRERSQGSESRFID